MAVFLPVAILVVLLGARRLPADAPPVRLDSPQELKR